MYSKKNWEGDPKFLQIFQRRVHFKDHSKFKNHRVIYRTSTLEVAPLTPFVLRRLNRLLFKT